MLYAIRPVGRPEIGMRPLSSYAFDDKALVKLELLNLFYNMAQVKIKLLFPESENQINEMENIFVGWVPTPGFLWVPMDSYGFLRVPMGSYGLLWVPMVSYGFLWVPTAWPPMASQN